MEAHGSGGSIRCPACDKVPARDDTAGVVHSEPATHCEWCGAEYPLPESTDATESTPPGSEAEGGPPR